MNNSSFVHLHVHNEYSYLDGYGSTKAYITKAKELGHNYLALTNHGNLDGLLQWQKECDRQGLHPILGCEGYLVPDRHIKQKGEKRGHITLLIKNENGWKTMCAMLTEANLTGFYHRPRIDYNLLLNNDLSGLIIMTACAGSFLNLPASTEFFKKLIQKTDVYFEIMPHDIPSQHAIHDRIKTLSKIYPGIPFIATNDCHYVEPDEAEAQEMLLAINSRAKWDDPKRWKFGFKGLHLRTADEMLTAFQKQGDWSEDIVKEAMANTVKISRKCFQFRILKQDISLPRSSAKQKDEPALMDSICKDGYKKIFGNDNWPQEYKDRYLEEFKLITKKKFERYFLIVYDLVNWARGNNIAIGPGRGSVGGSLIAYLMEITKIDPIKFKLSFARFISEDRQDYPDIDCDFEKRDRGKVVKYLEETYGEYNTCGVSTSMTMQSRAAIRDVGRVMEIPSKEVGIFANSIWGGDHGENSAIQDSIDNRKEGKYFARKYPDAIRLMLKMEGQVRGCGAHAAAVIISKEDLRKSNKCVLVKRNKRIVCNWTMEDSEFVGLMKLDVLGLSTLSVLSECKRLINKKDNLKAFFQDQVTGKHLFLNIMEREFEEKYKNYSQVEFDFNKIPLEDEETFDNISKGKTTGIFQLSGHACTALCKKMKIHSFEDIVAVVALARPGPADSGMTEDYIARKHGEKWNSMHQIYEEVTKDTYGLLVYQEQIMQVISKVAGLSESTADKIRKVIAKKRDAKDFKKFRKQFIIGCKKMQTLSKKEAEEFWEGLLKWASYGFNRSHSVGYALIAYWTAYLKTHCKKEFYAASLTYGEWNEKSRDQNKNKNSLLSEIRQAGYIIIPPKRKYSDAIKWQFHDEKLYVPFTEIIGVGENNAGKCLEPVKQNRLQGFFGTDYNAGEKQDTKLNQLLKELKVDEPETIPSTKILSKYLPHLDFKGNESNKYPNLAKLFGEEIALEDLTDFLALRLNPDEVPKNFIQRKRFRLEKQILQCNRCNLRKQVKKRPVLSSIGLNNVAILLEAPGKNEDEQGIGAVGKAGEVLWEELTKYEYNRRFFHLTNACHCWPSQSKTPSYLEISACYKWLHYELDKLQCRLILACGNIPLYALTGRKGGITGLSGETEWIENISAWACFSIHPSAVLRDRKKNLEPFQEGIKNFIEKLELLK